MDCGVPVFGALADLSRAEILTDMPDAVDGKTVDQWKNYLRQKGFVVTQFGPDDQYPLPCAHLVVGAHWVYQAKDSGIHDPSPVFQFTPPKLININEHYGGRILTIAVDPVKGF